MSPLLAGTFAREGTMQEGWIETDGERVAAAGAGAPRRREDERLEGVIAPGLCDLQVNGAGGREVAEGAPAIEAIDRVQLEHGVTRYLPTLISPDDATARRVLPELAERVADPSSPVIGVHVEGPFLSRHYSGMHPPERLRSPSEGVPAWLRAPPVRLVTLAPELPGALELTRELIASGVAVALGHSGADAATAAKAIDAGATLVTHVFNAMAPLAHRNPGLAGLALIDERVRVAVIADGVHIDALVLELVRRAAGSRAVLVSDATPAAAAAAGAYAMAGVAIESDDAGRVRTTDGRIAGSALTLDRALAGWLSQTGATLAQAVFAASEAPATVLGDEPSLAPGSPAELVVLDEAGCVRRVMHRGRWL